MLFKDVFHCKKTQHFVQGTLQSIQTQRVSYKEGGTLLAESIYTYKTYPTDAGFRDIAQVLNSKHPSLREARSFNESYGWKCSIKVKKMTNYRTQLRAHGTRSAELGWIL